MTDRAYIISRTLETKIAMAENNGNNALIVTLDVLKEILSLLKEQELPTELKQKMWNALYAEEDEYEKKFVGKEEHRNWFTVYRPWLQKGFDIAINAIADWEGR